MKLKLKYLIPAFTLALLCGMIPDALANGGQVAGNSGKSLTMSPRVKAKFEHRKEVVSVRQSKQHQAKKRVKAATTMRMEILGERLGYHLHDSELPNER